jgi:hypothetical protein
MRVKGHIMSQKKSSNAIRPECVDVVMQELPNMYRAGGFANKDCVYGLTYYAVLEELKRGASPVSIRHQTTQILQTVDATDRPPHDKELFAALLARAVDDALEGRAPCVLH